ncbi:MAG: hypothetical protein ACI865_000533 [Flavobacteriaceae bacterium]|jgi:hypothetical protein
MLRATSVFLLLLLFPFIGSSQTVWINEIHYDNTGGDVGEGVEIAAMAGTNLACYDIIAVNGSTGATYSTVTLSGIIPDEGCNYGAIWFPIAGLQNGAPDGLALYNTCTGTIIQFLNYEGTTITATSAPIAGAASTNIGVTETTGTPVGESLQLTGSGNNYAAFTWNAPAAVSPGTLNVGQTISPCGGNTITTGAITTAPFTVDCTTPTTDAGSVAFTSTGTFNGANIYTVQLSDATGSFASPTTIGTLASTANSGSIPFTIPAATATGAGYVMRVISDDPGTIGSSSTAFTITQSTPCLPSIPVGLIINEWSNGASGLPGGGNREYYEFVVAGECGSSVDIRGYILDDNNGTFTAPASYSGTSSGIAPGHFRFTFDAQWAAIPVGSLIVVYNRNDINPNVPADDPTDSNVDSLYVVGHDHATLFERCTAFPTSASPDSVYTPCAYAVSPLNGWGPLSLRNGGDAIQVRNPDGSYYHGVSYGGAEMSGGPHNLKLFTGSGTEQCGWFTDGDFFDISNWTSGGIAGNETPGAANNAANAAWLLAMRDTSGATCPIVVLPVELSRFEGKKLKEGNLLHWQTQSEYNAAYFALERSTNGKDWTEIHTQPAVGQSTSTQNYSFVDTDYNRVLNYYRLSETDNDGTAVLYHKYVVLYNSSEEGQLLKIINALGQEINESTRGIQIHVYSDGRSVKHFKQ